MSRKWGDHRQTASSVWVALVWASSVHRGLYCPVFGAEAGLCWISPAKNVEGSITSKLDQHMYIKVVGKQAGRRSLERVLCNCQMEVLTFWNEIFNLPFSVSANECAVRRWQMFIKVDKQILKIPWSDVSEKCWIKCLFTAGIL